MKELDVVTINEQDYVVLKECTKNNKTYLYLSNINDDDDTLIRKVDENDKNTVIPLESENEFELACNLFIKEIAQ